MYTVCRCIGKRLVSDVCVCLCVFVRVHRCAGVYGGMTKGWLVNNFCVFWSIELGWNKCVVLAPMRTMVSLKPAWAI